MSNETDPLNNDVTQKPQVKERLPSLNLTRMQIAGLSLLLLFGIGISFWLYQKYSSAPSLETPRKVSLAIFPFENQSENKELDYLSLSLADSLTNSLSPISNAKIAPTENIKKYLGKPYIANNVAKELGIDNVITGSFQIKDAKILIDVQIKNVSKEKPLVLSQSFESSLSDLISLRLSIHKYLVAVLNLNRTNSELLEIQRQETQNPQAYEYYLKGSNAYFNTQMDQAINYYQKAIELDPNFLPPLEGLASGYRQKGSIGGCGKPCYQKSTEYFEKMLQIAPDYERGELNLSIAYVDSNQIDKSIPLIKEVMARNPESKHAYFYLAYAYRYAGLLDESARLAEESRTIDDQVPSYTNLIISYLYQQKYEKFLQDNIFPSNNSYGLFYKGLANYYLKNYPVAKKAFDEAYEISPGLIEKIGKVYSYHLDKQDNAARQLLGEIHREIIKNQVSDGEIIYKVVQAVAELKQPKQALELFNLSIEDGFFCYPYFQNDPLLENLRKEPQFAVILQKAQKKHEDFKNKYLTDKN